MPEQVYLHRIYPRDTLFKMQKAILTLSKNTSLIEQIRSNLEEGGRFYVQGVTSAHSSLAMVRHRFFDIAILDLDQSDLTAAQLVYNLKKIQPEIKILVYASEDADAEIEFKDLPLDGILKKPFFAPELSDLLKALFQLPLQDEEPTVSDQHAPELPGDWQEYPHESIEEMSHLLSKTSAISAMIFHQGDLISQSPGLAPAEAERVIDFIEKNWKTFKNCEICRFMRGEGEYGPHLVYALSLSGELLLVFTYPTKVDLRTVRRETSKVRDAYMIGRYSQSSTDDAEFLPVSHMAEEDGVEPPVQSMVDVSSPGIAPDLLDAVSSQWIPEFEAAEPRELAKTEEEVAHVEPESETDGETVIDTSVTSLDPLSDTQPIQVYNQGSTQAAGSESLPVEQSTQPESHFSENGMVSEPQEQYNTRVPFTDGIEPGDDQSQPGLEALPLEISSAIAENAKNVLEDELPATPVDLSPSLPPEEGPATSDMANVLVQSDLDSEAAAVTQSAETATQLSFEEFRFVYHCLIVPRDPGQFLTRELAGQSAAVIRETHLTQGWELTSLSVRPQYALWTVRLPFSASPVDLVEKIKEETSDRIKSNLPAPTGEVEELSFWAPGYWILSGQQPPSGRLIQQFLKTRRQNNLAEQNQA